MGKEAKNTARHDDTTTRLSPSAYGLTIKKEHTDCKIVLKPLAMHICQYLWKLLDLNGVIFSVLTKSKSADLNI